MTRPLDTLTADELDALADEPCGFVVATEPPCGYYLTDAAEAYLAGAWRWRLQLVTS